MNTFTNNGSRGEPLIGVSAEVEQCPACSKLATYIDDEVQWHNTRCAFKSRDKLQRIHIVGGSGSGKTTLAHQIGARLGIEVYELDLIAFTASRFPSELSVLHYLSASQGFREPAGWGSSRVTGMADLIKHDFNNWSIP